MSGRNVDGHPRLHRQTGRANIGRVAVARFRQANLRPLLLQQIDHVLLFSNQALKFRVRKTLVELAHHLFQHGRVKRIGENKGKTRLRLRG